MDNDEIVEETVEDVIDEPIVDEPEDIPVEDSINWQERALKAEQLIEKNKKKAKEQPKVESTTQGLSPKDYLALTESKITSEDFEEVERVAKILGKPLSEALQDTTLKSILKTRAEERQTAAATQTGGGRRAAKAPDGDRLIQQAEGGELPDDDADIQKLAEARMEGRLKK